MHGADPRSCAPPPLPASSSAAGAAQGRLSEAAHHHQQYQQPPSSSTSSFSLFKSPHDQPSKRQRLQADLARRTEQFAPHPRYYDTPPPPPPPPPLPPAPTGHAAHAHANAHSGGEYEAREAQREFEDARHYLLGRADWTGVRPPPPSARAQETANEGDPRDGADAARRGRLLERAAGPGPGGGPRWMNADDPLAPRWHDQHQQYQHSVGRSELDDEWSYRCADLQEPQDEDEDQDEEADELEMIRQSQSCAPPVFHPPAQPPAQAEVRVEARAEVEAPTECKQRKAAQEARQRELSPLPPSPAFTPIVSRRSGSAKGQRQPPRSKGISARESSVSSESGTATASRTRIGSGSGSGAFDLERELEHGEEQEDEVALLAPPRRARASAHGRSSVPLTAPGESDADAHASTSVGSSKSEHGQRTPSESSETPRAATPSADLLAERASASSPAPHREPVPASHGPSARVIREAHSDPVRPAVTLHPPASSDQTRPPTAPSTSPRVSSAPTLPPVAPLVPLPSKSTPIEPLHPLPTKPASSAPGPEHQHEEDEHQVEPEAKSEASTAPSSTQAELLRLEQELDQVRSVIHAKVQRALFGPPFAAAAAPPPLHPTASPTQGSRG